MKPIFRPTSNSGAGSCKPPSPAGSRCHYSRRILLLAAGLPLAVAACLAAPGCTADNRRSAQSVADSTRIATEERWRLESLRKQARQDSVRQATIAALSPLFSKPIVASSLSPSQKRALVNLFWYGTLNLEDPQGSDDGQNREMNEFERREWEERRQARFRARYGPYEDVLARTQATAKDQIHSDVIPCSDVKEFDFERHKYTLVLGGIEGHVYLHWVPVYPRALDDDDSYRLSVDEDSTVVLELVNDPWALSGYLSFPVDEARARVLDLATVQKRSEGIGVQIFYRVTGTALRPGTWTRETATEASVQTTNGQTIGLSATLLAYRVVRGYDRTSPTVRMGSTIVGEDFMALPRFARYEAQGDVVLCVK